MEKDKRYLVFTYDSFYPSGGMNDFKASFDTVEEAKHYATHKVCDGYNIYDRIEGEEVD